LEKLPELSEKLPEPSEKLPELSEKLPELWGTSALRIGKNLDRR
jgi:hypothetical protein